MNKKSGKMMPARTVASQIISGAITHVVIPVICNPSVNTAVIIRTANVDTSAIPPRRAGAYLIAILSTKGDSRMYATVKKIILIIKPKP